MEFQIDSVRWKARFPHRNADPVKVHQEVEVLRKKNGGTVSPGDLVHKARSPKSAMHRIFEWDNGAASDQYRLIQARRVLRSMEIVYLDKEVGPTRAWEIIEKKKRGTDNKTQTLYSTLEETMADPGARESLLAEAIGQLMAWRRRFRMLNEFDRVFGAIDLLRNEL